ncbi:NADPH-dependent FMN reductase [Pueribacillus sp. YX66]|uniref:NADPH-dependent FMN reductase n=1 Tax=Pueribacillus sp. YX66 TaxID=3229242 RepID=UPI00358CEC2A
MNIIVLVGSLRQESYNMHLAKMMQKRYKYKLNLKIANIGALPHFNQDEEHAPPQVVKKFKQDILEADGVMIITPEYNWSVPGVLKNAIDWASRVDKVFNSKPVMTVGVTIGMAGTVRAQLHLRQILSAPGIQANVLAPGGHEILIPFAAEKFDSSGELIDEATLSFLDSIVDKFIDFISTH